MTEIKEGVLLNALFLSQIKGRIELCMKYMSEKNMNQAQVGLPNDLFTNENRVNQKEVYFIIPAAGVGNRMEADIPKQYLEIAGKTILTHTINLWIHCKSVSGGVVVLSPEDHTALEITHPRLWQTVGGATRTDSVFNGLQFLADRLSSEGKNLADIWIAVHDAARPGLRESELSHFLQQVVEDAPKGGAIMALPAQDTIKQVNADGNIEKTLNRDHIWLAQTPQMAPLSLLLSATQKIMDEGANVTDEASVLEYNGFFPKVYRGYHHNFKITYPEDLQLMSLYFSERKQCE